MGRCGVDILCRRYGRRFEHRLRGREVWSQGWFAGVQRTGRRVGRTSR